MLTVELFWHISAVYHFSQQEHQQHDRKCGYLILLIPVNIHRIIWKEKYDQKFFDQWHKAREQGFKINVVRESVKGFVLMVVIVVIGQFFGNGLTLLDIVYKLPSGVLVWLLLLRG